MFLPAIGPSRIDTAAGRVTGRGPEGKSFNLTYDRLLIATGAEPIVPQRPGFDRPDVAVVKTLEDAQAIKAHLQTGKVKTAVIMGMGYIAMEMVEALRARGVSVTMVKPRAELLPWLDARFGPTVRRELEANQVHLRTGFDVAGIEGQEGRLTVYDEAGTSLSCGPGHRRHGCAAQQRPGRRRWTATGIGPIHCRGSPTANVQPKHLCRRRLRRRLSRGHRPARLDPFGPAGQPRRLGRGRPCMRQGSIACKASPAPPSSKCSTCKWPAPA